MFTNRKERTELLEALIISNKDATIPKYAQVNHLSVFLFKKEKNFPNQWNLSNINNNQLSKYAEDPPAVGWDGPDLQAGTRREHERVRTTFPVPPSWPQLQSSNEYNTVNCFWVVGDQTTRGECKGGGNKEGRPPGPSGEALCLQQNAQAIPGLHLLPSPSPQEMNHTNSLISSFFLLFWNLAELKIIELFGTMWFI